ncbi:ParB N-terminal domain-containing protein [Candidatus Bathyarchaeota archaeon]|nr:ParB N-terminal domain-containing protein [Candidatus Bathyarchaeota archaeon]
MEIQSIEISKLNLAKYNPRKDLQPGDPDYEKLKKSILEFDLVEPLVWNKRTGNLVGGHQRLKILKEMGHTEVEVSVVDLPEAKEKLLNLALNKIQGEWDRGKLRQVLEELDTGEFDMEIAGFDRDELEKILVEGTPFNIDDLLKDLDFTLAIEKPIWLVVRTSADNQEKLDRIVALLEKEGIRVERSYDS